MKVIKPFFLGMLGGLALGLALWVGLYVSPLREPVYFAVDAELADVRSKLDQYQEWLAQTDLRLAQAQADPAFVASDSLRNAQTKAWRDYKAWRNRLGDLARAHAKPTAEGFWPWTFSLAYWIPSIAALLALLPGVFFAWRARVRFRPGIAKGGDVPPKNARAQALAHFEEAIRKVARISEHERGSEDRRPVERGPVEHGHVERGPVSIEPPTAFIPAADIGLDPGRNSGVEYPESKEPDTVPIPVIDEPRKPVPAPHAFQMPSDVAPSREAEAGDPSRETAFFQMGAPWGEPAGERIGNPVPPGTPPGKNPGGLSMEDEDGTRAIPGGVDPEDEETLGAMPPTTEVERVERRKEEVLKLARKGMTSSEISRRMRISQDQVDFIIRLRREKG